MVRDLVERESIRIRNKTFDFTNWEYKELKTLQQTGGKICGALTLFGIDCFAQNLQLSFKMEDEALLRCTIGVNILNLDFPVFVGVVL